MNHPVKEFWRLVQICQSYCQTSRGILFWDRVYIKIHKNIDKKYDKLRVTAKTRHTCSFFNTYITIWHYSLFYICSLYTKLTVHTVTPPMIFLYIHNESETVWPVLSMYWLFLSASSYVSKRGAYWDRLCRDVVGRWLVGRWSSRACTVARL